MPPDDGKHYKPYDQICGAVTNETRMQSMKTSKNMECNTPFNPVQQHALYKRLMIKDRTQCFCMLF